MRVDVPSISHTSSTARATRAKEHLVVGALLVVWCVHLILYVVIVPPWQHYDEPTHFEYAALIRETGGVPPGDEHIPELRRDIARSMLANGFYRNPIAPIEPPDLDSPNLSLGINERGHPPLYYALVALATLPLRHASIEAQLYAGRAVSALLGVLLFIAAYVLLRLLTDDWERRCWVLAALALQPAFADNMSALNSDALANFAGVLVMLAAVWIVHASNRFFRLANRFQHIVIVYLIPLCVLLLAVNVKRTLLAFGLVIPAAWLLAAPRRWRIVAGIGIAASVVGALLWLLAQPWALADWYGTAATTPANAAYAGRSALVVNRNQTLEQTVYPRQAESLLGQRVTLAAWMRADRDGVTVSSPMLVLDNQTISRTVTIGMQWQQVLVEADVPSATTTVRVRLETPDIPANIYYDSLALVAGGADHLPAPGEPDGSFEIGLLASPPRNVLRNADAERWIPVLDALPIANRVARPDILSRLFNPAWIAAAYPYQALALFESAWGVFGWGEISVSVGWFAPLGVLVLVSIAGALRHTWHVTTETPRTRAMWWLCLLAVALGWGTALLRVHDQPFPGGMFWSFGRYTFVAMVPSMIVFVYGLVALIPKFAQRQALTGVLVFLLIFAFAAL